MAGVGEGSPYKGSEGSRRLRIALGHSRLETTQQYLRTGEAEVVERVKDWYRLKARQDALGGYPQPWTGSPGLAP